jgi:hypothetical protein
VYHVLGGGTALVGVIVAQRFKRAEPAQAVVRDPNNA